MKSVRFISVAVALFFCVLFISGAKQESKPPNRAQVYDAPQKVCPVLVGTKIPDVALRDVKGDTVQLTEKISGKPTVLIFYRGRWCVYCNRQLGQLIEIEKNILEVGFQIIAISPDKPDEIQKSYGQHKMNYTLLSDSPADAAKAFGIAFRVDDPMLKKLADYKIDINKASGYEHNILPVPSVFVIDAKGMITFEYVNPAYDTRLHPSVLLAAIKAESINPK